MRAQALSPKTVALIAAVKELLLEQLQSDDFHPRVFKEISDVAATAHEMLRTIDPLLNVPIKPLAPVAPALSSENFGAKLVREFMAAVGGRSADKVDLLKAIAVAEKEGLDKDARLLRAQLHGDPPAPPEGSSPQEKVEWSAAAIETGKALSQQADRILASAGSVLEEVKPDALDPAPVVHPKGEAV